MLAGQRSVDVGSSSGMMPKAALPKLKVKAAAVPISSAAVAPLELVKGRNMAIINTANIGPDTPDVRAMAAWMRPPKFPARKAKPVERKPKPSAISLVILAWVVLDNLTQPGLLEKTSSQVTAA